MQLHAGHPASNCGMCVCHQVQTSLLDSQPCRVAPVSILRDLQPQIQAAHTLSLPDGLCLEPETPADSQPCRMASVTAFRSPGSSEAGDSGRPGAMMTVLVISEVRFFRAFLTLSAFVSRGMGAFVGMGGLGGMGVG